MNKTIYDRLSQPDFRRITKMGKNYFAFNEDVEERDIRSVIFSTIELYLENREKPCNYEIGLLVEKIMVNNTQKHIILKGFELRCEDGKTLKVEDEEFFLLMDRVTEILKKPRVIKVRALLGELLSFDQEQINRAFEVLIFGKNSKGEGFKEGIKKLTDALMGEILMSIEKDKTLGKLFEKLQKVELNIKTPEGADSEDIITSEEAHLIYIHQNICRLSKQEQKKLMKSFK